MNGFFIYRLPDTDSFIGGAGKVLTKPDASGFIISSFDNTPESFLNIMKEKEFSIDDLRTFMHKFYEGSYNAEAGDRLFQIPLESTSEEKHKKNVLTLKDSLNEGEKSICCAAIIGEKKVDIYASFLSLALHLPDAFVFCFYTPQSGIWLGASPELLLKNKGSSLSTMALAGTRVIGKENNWDNKNIEEQRMVIEYIVNILERYNLPYKYDSTPFTKKAGIIEHLCTPFIINGKRLDKDKLFQFLSDFSPTPALCGLPKDKAYRLINEAEDFSRGYYGGFCGPFIKESDFTFYVLLRALRIEKECWCMFAGGGITTLSNPQEEWVETRRKASSILDKISFIPSAHRLS